ncbi:MAG: hypothetical protein AAGN82_05975 [Myxococcota bacterium]
MAKRPLGPHFRRRRGQALVGAAIWGALAATTVHVAPVRGAEAGEVSNREEAKRLFDRGRIAFRGERFEEAILRWQESFELSKEPLILWNIANAFEALERPSEALDYLERWSPHASGDEREELNERMDRLRAATRAATERDAAKGDEADDDDDARKTKSSSEADEGGERNVASHDGLAVAGWSLLGVGLVGVSVGVVTGVVAAGARPDLDDACRPEGGQGGTRLCGEEARADVARSRNLALAADVTWASGATVAVVGLTMALYAMTTGEDVAAAAPSTGEEEANLLLGPGRRKHGEREPFRLHPDFGYAPQAGWHGGISLFRNF